VFVQRIDSEKHGLLYDYVLLWSDFDSRDVHDVKKIIDVNHPKDSLIVEHQEVTCDF
jgi:hypothetical protein